MATRYGWLADTDEKAFKVLVDLLRKKTSRVKLRMVFEMIELGMRLDRHRIRKQYPAASEREVFLRTAVLRLGADMVKRIYGWDPDNGIAP